MYTNMTSCLIGHGMFHSSDITYYELRAPRLSRMFVEDRSLPPDRSRITLPDKVL
uniref:Uncharacterized protein n=1 Tax=Candidatus Methanogaster sp. ANME-2c ERB4 TaxID=2759911 RepID=A0A7G9XZP8_9EURY|nr:hypothetical protein APGBGGHG_00015 [Methanosarcinales archaeon ANME-2c ERB4]QNO41659.1 hypothetical protein DEHNNBFE_00015 [Methanosarcinales archaeon ANME-2c ERB4]